MKPEEIKDAARFSNFAQFFKMEVWQRIESHRISETALDEIAEVVWNRMVEGEAKAYDNGRAHRDDVPMGVSQWRNHGEKFGYAEFWGKDLMAAGARKFAQKVKAQLRDPIWIMDGDERIFVLRVIDAMLGETIEPASLP